MWDFPWLCYYTKRVIPSGPQPFFNDMQHSPPDFFSEIVLMFFLCFSMIGTSKPTNQQTNQSTNKQTNQSNQATNKPTNPIPSPTSPFWLFRCISQPTTSGLVSPFGNRWGTGARIQELQLRTGAGPLKFGAVLVGGEFFFSEKAEVSMAAHLSFCRPEKTSLIGKSGGFFCARTRNDG